MKLIGRHNRNTSVYSFLIIVFTISLFMIISCLLTSAHSGDTDSQYGHFDYSAGEYHYHHGYPAHQHNSGKCQYNVVDGSFSIMIGKIFIFIVGALAIPLYVNMIVGGVIGLILDKFSTKKSNAEEKLLSDEKQDKIWKFFSILLYIVELIIWAIIVIQW